MDAPLRGLLAEAERFDALAGEARRAALIRVAGHLAALIEVPREVAEAARLGTVRPAAEPRAPAPGTPPSRSPSRSRSPLQPSRRRRPRRRPRRRSVRHRRRRRGARHHARHAAGRRCPGSTPAPRALLEERGRLTAGQALEFWPRIWQDRTTLRRIAELPVGQEGIVLADVQAVRQKRMRNGRAMLEVSVTDGSAPLGLVFFNAPPWKEKQVKPGDTLLCWGKVSEGFGGRRQMTNPELERHQPGDSANFSRIVPIYPGPAGWQHPALRKVMKRLCDELAPRAPEDLPAAVRAAAAAAGPRRGAAPGPLPGARHRPGGGGGAGHAGLQAAGLRGVLLPPARPGAAPARREGGGRHRLRDRAEGDGGGGGPAPLRR